MTRLVEGVIEVDITSAALRIRDAEEALGRVLSAGERNDLIIDNFPNWASDYCRRAVKLATAREEANSFFAFRRAARGGKE